MVVFTVPDDFDPDKFGALATTPGLELCDLKTKRIMPNCKPIGFRVGNIFRGRLPKKHGVKLLDPRQWE